MTEPTEHAAELDETVILSNDRRLHIRALRPGEDGPIRALDAHLSQRTRYLRFLSPLLSLPDSVVRLLAGVDNRRRVAVVAENDEDRGEIVGLGSFSATDDCNVEVALVVRDDWQRQRVGTELAIRLLQAAEARGFHRFVAHVAADNMAVRRLLKNFGDVVSTKVSGAVSEFVFVRRPIPMPTTAWPPIDTQSPESALGPDRPFALQTAACCPQERHRGRHEKHRYGGPCRARCRTS